MFVTWSKTRRPRPALDPGSPAQASLPTEQLPPQGRSPINLLDCASRRFAGLSTVPAWHPNRSPSAKTARCSAALLGPITPASRFAHQSNLHEEDRTRNRVALEKTGSSGASSRLAPTRTEALIIACRRRSELRDLPPEGGSNRRPDHMSTMHLAPESQKQNFW